MALAPTVKIWQPFAPFHLHSARVLCEKAIEIEDLLDGSKQSLEALKDEHMAYVTGSIFAVVAFLEALINETFLNAAGFTKGDLHNRVLQKLAPVVITSMAHAWEFGTDWSSEPSFRQFLEYVRRNLPERWFVLDKYQLALYLADKYPYSKPFDTKGQLWGDMTLLIDLRNYLTHHKPEWIAFSPEAEPYTAEKDQTTRLLRELGKRNFANPLYPGQGSIVNLLGSKCASWSVSSSITFVKEFKDKMPLDLSSIPEL
jgi:hypothetical protein